MSTSSDSGGGPDEYDIIVAPPDIFAGDNCATPTPGDFITGPGAGMDSGTSTPRYMDSPSVDTPPSKTSPLATFLLKTEKPSDPPVKSKTQPSNLAQSSHKAPNSPPNGSSASHHDQQLSKLSIAPRDSPVAVATSRVLSILSNTQPKMKASGRNVADPSSEETVRGVAGCSEEGTNM